MNLWLISEEISYLLNGLSRSDLSNSFVNVMSSPVLAVLVIEVHKDLNLQSKGVLVTFSPSFL